MIGDFFTKPLQGQLFRRLRSLVMNCPVDIPPEYMSPRDTSREDTGVCWDIAHPDQPEPGARTPTGPPNGPGAGVRTPEPGAGTPTGPPNGPGVGVTPTGPPNRPRAGAKGPGRPETDHTDTTPRVERHHGGTSTAPAPAHRKLKVSDRRHPAGRGEGRTVPPSTSGGRLKASGRTKPTGRSSNIPAL